MSKYLISGNRKLQGEIQVSGSKNAVLALMAACLLTDEECVLTNVPRIKDVEKMVEIITDLGAGVTWTDHQLLIKAQNLSKTEPAPSLVAKLRGSILLLGPLLARMGKVDMVYPGGDLIGQRPVDVHISALQTLGAVFDNNGKPGTSLSVPGKLKFSTSGLVGSRIVLEESSVTGTENAMMAAVLAKGKTTIRLAAMEPHVQQLGQFLNRMGARISGMGSPTIVIEGMQKLHGAKIEIIPDSEEAASLITLAAATKSNVRVNNLVPDYLEDYFVKLRKMKVDFTIGKNFVEVRSPDHDYVGAKIQSGLYPKLNSDYVPPMAVLATQAAGESYIYEWLYENRLGYVPELVKMGAKAEVLDPHRVKIAGATPLHGAKITSYDLRMGMTLVIAGLVAEGQSEIDKIEHIDRGYENLEQRLASLGASIKRSE